MFCSRPSTQQALTLFSAFKILKGLISIDSFSIELNVLITDVLCSMLLTVFNRD